MKRRAMNLGISFVIMLMIILGMLSISGFGAFAVTDAAEESRLKSAVAEGGTVRLTDDIWLSSTLAVGQNKAVTVTLDLNGHRLMNSAKADGSVIRVYEGGSLTVKDSEGYDNGLITGGRSVDGGGIYNEGSLRIEGGTLANNSASGNGGAVLNKGRFVMMGGVIKSNQANNGGAVYSGSPDADNSGCELKLSYATIKANKSEGFGGAVATYNSAELDTCVFRDNTAGGDGGALHIDAKNGAVKINKCTFDENFAKNGAGINVLRTSSPVEITDTKLKNNSAQYNGGAIQNLSGVSLKDCAVFSNNAHGKGGGVYVNYSTLSVRGKIDISDNIGYVDNNSDKEVSSNNNDNVYLKNDRKITLSGKLESGSKIGVSCELNNNVITQGYTEFHSESVNTFFFADNDEHQLLWDKDNKSSSTEIKLITGISIVMVYNSKGTLTDTLTFTDVKKAWNSAESKATSSVTAEVKLGDNLVTSSALKVGDSKKMRLDLNGYYIRRTTEDNEDESEGNVITVGKSANFTIKDSRPDSKGYAGYRGGVITGGYSSDDGGGIYIEDVSRKTKFYMTGGTIYNCKSTDNGGGIFIEESGGTINLKNCRIVGCSADEDGGAIYNSAQDLLLENVTLDGNYADNDGGGVFYDYYKNKVGTAYFKNVNFCGNACEDYGGAVKFDTTPFSASTILDFENCFFYNNQSLTDDGGAIYIENTDRQNEVWYDTARNNRRDQPKQPLLIKNCVFRYNYAGDEGGAIYVNDDKTVLVDCTITDNESEDDGGGVYVDSYYDLGVKGLVVIKDNKCLEDDNPHHNLCLQEGIASTARLYSGGLYKGSYIGVSTTDNETHFARDITEYQMRYFHPDTGKIEFVKDGTYSSPMIYGSLFGNGSFMVVLIGVIAAAAIAAVAIVYKKKKGAVKNDKEADE